MTTRRLDTSARVYIGVVALAGVLAALGLLSGFDLPPEDRGAFALFCALGVGAAAVPITYRKSSPSRITHQIGSSFVYPLLILVNPGALYLAFVLTTLADALIHRRRPITVGFNLSQLALACWAGVSVRQWFWPEFDRLTRLETSTLLAAAASISMFAVVNHALTQGVLSLVNRRPFLSWSWYTRTGLATEALCIAAGLGMAVFWRVHPGLVVLGVIPVWAAMLIIRMLDRREQELARRERELRSLQGLGLEIGSELDAPRVETSVLRIACEALEVPVSMLGRWDESRTRLTIHACRGIDAPTPFDLVLRRGAAQHESAHPPEVRKLSAEELAQRFPLLASWGYRGALEAWWPEGGGPPEGILLAHDGRRRAFDSGDLRRLETLVRFIEVALANAALVTERRDMQSQLFHAEKMSAVGLLVSGVAHEVNNPLTSILGFAEILRQREQDPRDRRMLEAIGAEAKRAGRIVSKLLTFSRKHKPEKATTQLNELIDEVLEFRDYELRAGNVAVEKRLDPQLPAIVADPHQLQQVLLNLITNAEQAISEGGSPGRIWIETARRGDRVSVVIADNGPGIPPAERSKVFLPFYTTKEVGAGTGLGLSICYGIVEDHGGRIEVESRPGGGARFVVELPLPTSPGEPRPSTPRTTARPPAAS